MSETVDIERVDHIGIRVRDLDRALAFYRILGFTLARRATGDDVAIYASQILAAARDGAGSHARWGKVRPQPSKPWAGVIGRSASSRGSRPGRGRAAR